MTNKPFYLLLAIIAYVCDAYYQERILFNVIFSYLGGLCIYYALMRE